MSLGAIAKLRDINKNSQKRKRFYKDCNMEKVEINKNMKLSEHFTLGEMCKTKYKTADGNIPSHVVIENLKRICGWLEVLRVLAGVRPQSKVAGDCTLAPDPGAAPDPGPAGSAARAEAGAAAEARKEEAIVINSGYRSPEVNRLAGGVPSSNHVTGCAVDIRCAGKEQMIRYAAILLDIADGTKQDFDELLLEQHGSVCWLHFAVRPKDNRRRIALIKA
jgi:hypothetical protein